VLVNPLTRCDCPAICCIRDSGCLIRQLPASSNTDVDSINGSHCLDVRDVGTWVSTQSSQQRASRKLSMTCSEGRSGVGEGCGNPPSLPPEALFSLTYCFRLVAEEGRTLTLSEQRRPRRDAIGAGRFGRNVENSLDVAEEDRVSPEEAPGAGTKF
jgi:hypothetical protein